MKRGLFLKLLFAKQISILVDRDTLGFSGFTCLFGFSFVCLGFFFWFWVCGFFVCLLVFGWFFFGWLDFILFVCFFCF